MTTYTAFETRMTALREEIKTAATSATSTSEKNDLLALAKRITVERPGLRKWARS